MRLLSCLLTNNDCYRVGRTITPKGVMVHSTGANNTKLSRYVGPDDGILGVNPYGNHWNQGGITKCVHAFIGHVADGSIATYQTLPWHYRGWHGGGSSNNTHIGFEICEDALTDSTYFAAVYQEAVELTAHLCQMYQLNPLADGVVICHSEGYTRGTASNHGDVMHWFPRHGKSMDTFRQDVAAELTKEDDEMITIDQFKSLWVEMRAELQDNDSASWSQEARQWAVDQGLMSGSGTTPSGEANMMWEDVLTREQLITVMYRFAQLIGQA